MTDIVLVWVETYTREVGLDYSQEAARGFAKSLQGTVLFEWADLEAFDLRFEGQKPDIEAGEIIYFAGHGTRKGLQFEVENKDDGLARPERMRLGQRLVMAVFDSCKALEDEDRWSSVFGGLRYIVGFCATVGESPIRGARFAQLLLEGSTVKTAWMTAAIETEGKYAPARIIEAPRLIRNTVDEERTRRTTRAQAISSSPTLISWTEVLEDLVAVGDSPELTAVDFFRLLPKEEESVVRIIAEFFNMRSTDRRDVSAGSILISEEGTLELFSASDSFRWMHRVQRSRALFEEPESAPLLPAEAVRAANRFLERLGLLDDRVSLSSITSTHEVHRAPNGERRMDRIVARHVQYAFELAQLPIFGPGAKMRVTFESSEVDGFLRFWREPVREGSASVISSDEAERRLRTEKAFKHLPSTTIAIQSRKLGYLALPPTQSQEYLLPVYGIEGAVVTSAMRYDFVRYVPAIADEADLPPELSARLAEAYQFYLKPSPISP